MGVYGQYGPGPSVGWWVVMVIFMVLFWSVVVLGAAYVVRHWRGHQLHEVHGYGSGPGRLDAAAIEVLRMRFAKGEIDEAEFKSRLAMLEQRP